MRKFVALFVAAVFALAAGPAALAMPSAPPHAMTMTGTMQGTAMASHDLMPCAHCPHGMDRHQPCKDMAQCQTMQDCSGVVALAHRGAAHAPRKLTPGPIWGRHDAEPGITRRPDHPPPKA